MSATPQEAILKYQQCSEGAKTGYSVFMSYVNLDYKSDPKDTLLGIIIPCGSYATEAEAIKARDEISAYTGCPTVTYQRNGVHYQITSDIKKNALVYKTNEKESLSQIRESIYHARRRQRQLEEKIDQEREEREEPESMSRMINLVHHVTVTELRLNTVETSRIEMEKHLETSKKELYKLACARPDLYENWQTEAEERFKERGQEEILLFQQMVIGMQKHHPVIVSLQKGQKEQDD